MILWARRNGAAEGAGELVLGRDVSAVVLECNGARFLDGFVVYGLLEEMLSVVSCGLKAE